MAAQGGDSSKFSKVVSCTQTIDSASHQCGILSILHTILTTFAFNMLEKRDVWLIRPDGPVVDPLSGDINIDAWLNIHIDCRNLHSLLLDALFNRHKNDPMEPSLLWGASPPALKPAT